MPAADTEWHMLQWFALKSDGPLAKLVPVMRTVMPRTAAPARRRFHAFIDDGSPFF